MFVLGLGTKTRRGKLLHRDLLVVGSDHGRLRNLYALHLLAGSRGTRDRGAAAVFRPLGPGLEGCVMVLDHLLAGQLALMLLDHLLAGRLALAGSRQGCNRRRVRFTGRDRRFGLEVSPPADLDQPLLDAKWRATGNQGRRGRAGLVGGYRASPRGDHESPVRGGNLPWSRFCDHVGTRNDWISRWFGQPP